MNKHPVFEHLNPITKQTFTLITVTVYMNICVRTKMFTRNQLIIGYWRQPENCVTYCSLKGTRLYSKQFRGIKLNLLCLLDPAWLFDTNSSCHTQTHIAERWHKKPCATKTDSSRHAFLSLLSVVCCKSQTVSTRPSRLIAVLSCHITQQRWGGEHQRRLLLCWTLRWTGLLWAVR